MLSRKTVRYYYWLSIEFLKKYTKHILLSFLLSFIGIIIFISLTPYLQSFLLTDNDVVGIAGRYSVGNLPEDITSQVSNGLIFINDKGAIVPSLAETWNIDKKGQNFTFKLKRNLYWNDGREFTAQDINYKFKDVQTKIIDKYTIQFTLTKPLPIFPIYLKKPIIKYPLVGIAGLYRVDDLKIEFGNIKYMRLTPNKKDLPVVVYKFYDDEGQLVTAYKKGEIKSMQLSKKSLANDFATWKNSEVVKTVDYTRLMTLFFNTKNDFLSAKEVRQALRMLINPKDFEDEGIEAVGSINPLSWAYDADLKKEYYDPDTAEKILKKSKTASQSAQLNFNTSYDYFDIAQKISDAFKKADVNVSTNFVSASSDEDFDMLLAYWKVPLDPDQYYFWHSRQIGKGNVTNYKRPKIDLLLEKGRDATTFEDRKSIYDDFQKALLDDPPALFLFYPYTYTVKRK